MEPGQQQRAEATNGATSDDQNRFSGRQGKPSHGMQRNRERLRHRSHAGRKCPVMTHHKLCRKLGLLRETAVAYFADEAEFLADMGPAAQASRARAAPDARVSGNVVSDH